MFQAGGRFPAFACFAFGMFYRVTARLAFRLVIPGERDIADVVRGSE
jgi:hypothetical protein